VGFADSLRGVARLLEDVLPVAYTQNGMTIRNHVLETAERIETDMGEEKPEFFDGSEQDLEAQPLPDGPMTVGIDGGFVRAVHKEGFFEVIAGKSVVDFRHSDEEATPSSKGFSFVQTFDQKPRRRLWELLKSQGMQENQQGVFVSDGGDSVRNLQAYLHPDSEHWLDWFHITMRITVLQQQVKTFEVRTAGGRRGSGARVGEHQTFPLAWQHVPSAAALRRTPYRSGVSRGSDATDAEGGQGYWRIRDLHPQQRGVHPELRRTLPKRRDDQHGLR
jgi:hypothetical protein